MIDLAIMAGAYALFHATHGVADYWLQRDWQAQNKSKKGLLPFEVSLKPLSVKWIGWNTAVLSHSIEYALCFLPALFFLKSYNQNINIPILWLLIWLPHAWMDTRKFLNWFVATTKGWKPGDIDSAIQENETNKQGYVCSPIELEKYMIQAAVRVHVSIHLDQKFHYFSLVITSILAAIVS